MTKEQVVKRLEKGCEAEDYFPGVLGNPVIFAARWGLSLSKAYMADLPARRRKLANGKPTRQRHPSRR
jgi:hypothetical protein